MDKPRKQHESLPGMYVGLFFVIVLDFFFTRDLYVAVRTGRFRLGSRIGLVNIISESEHPLKFWACFIYFGVFGAGMLVLFIRAITIEHKKRRCARALMEKDN
jgi:hypothetical protein